MIKYALSCRNGHEFEAWFNSSAAFDDQQAKRLLSCPVCQSDEVQKALMAPRVVTTKGKGVARAPSAGPPSAGETESVYSPSQAGPSVAKVIEAMRHLRQQVEANTEDVGKRFAEEARKIHYEEAEARGIRGEATAEEVRKLSEEGIGVAPLPRLPEDEN